MRISHGGITTINNSLYIGQNDNYPDLRLGSVNGNSIGIATNATGFSNSSAAGNMVLIYGIIVLRST